MAIILEPKEAEKLEAPDSIEVITAHIIGGGYLEDLCKTWEISYARVRAWMLEDSDRDRAYVNALNGRAELETERIKRTLNRLSNRNSKGLMDLKTGKLLPPEKWPEEMFEAIESIQWDKDSGNIKSIQFTSKEGALALAGRTLAMFRDKISIDGKLSFEDMVVAADKAARGKVIDVSSEKTGLAAPAQATKLPQGDK